MTEEALKVKPGSGPRHVVFWRSWVKGKGDGYEGECVEDGEGERFMLQQGMLGNQQQQQQEEDSKLFMFVVTELTNTVTSYAVTYPLTGGMSFEQVWESNTFGSQPIPEGAAAAEIAIVVSFLVNLFPTAHFVRALFDIEKKENIYIKKERRLVKIMDGPKKKTNHVCSLHELGRLHDHLEPQRLLVLEIRSSLQLFYHDQYQHHCHCPYHCHQYLRLPSRLLPLRQRLLRLPPTLPRQRALPAPLLGQQGGGLGSGGAAEEREGGCFQEGCSEWEVCRPGGDDR